MVFVCTYFGFDARMCESYVTTSLYSNLPEFAYAATAPSISGTYNQTICRCSGIQCSAMLPELSTLYVSQNGSDVVIRGTGSFVLSGAVNPSGALQLQLGDSFLWCTGQTDTFSINLTCSFAADPSLTCSPQYALILPSPMYIGGNYSVKYSPVADLNSCGWILPKSVMLIAQANGSSAVQVHGAAEAADPMNGFVNATGYMDALGGSYLKCSAQFGSNVTRMFCSSIEDANSNCTAILIQNPFPTVSGMIPNSLSMLTFQEIILVLVHVLVCQRTVNVPFLHG